MLNQIIEKIQSKGWNLYVCSDNETASTIIPRGPVSSLEVGKQYLLFPKIDDPTDVKALQAASKLMTDYQRGPRIENKGRSIAMVMVAVDEDRILVRGNIEDYLSYEELYKDLDTLWSPTPPELN